MDRKIVYFEWYDACGRDGWISAQPDQLPKIPLVKSIGWLIHEDDTTIHITSGWEVDQDGCMGVIAVPKGWIKKRKYVKV